jgi:hypothetical protein
MLLFFDNVTRALKPDGKAVVSILRDFIPDSEDLGIENTTSEPSTVASSITNSPMCIPSVDHPGLVYIKHPPTEAIKEGIKTETFRLDVEDETGKLIRTHELSWDERMFDQRFWEKSVKDKGLKVREVIEGKIQIWYVLEHV